MDRHKLTGFTRATPPLKWAGGKRWFAARYLHLAPRNYRKYIEPFLGSGALFFALQPEKSILSDLNEDLINFYECIRDKPLLLKRYLQEHGRRHSKNYYYKMRDEIPKSKTKLAARLLYLNRTCWNGLYRVNRCGVFNVPIGTKTAVVLPTDDFNQLSSLLSASEITTSDFEETIARAGRNDFVFADPPYTVSHNNNGFLKYNEKIFSWDDQMRLSIVIKKAVNRGANVLLTNANHESVKKLYNEFEITPVTRASVIAGSSTARGVFDEVVIRCYR